MTTKIWWHGLQWQPNDGICNDNSDDDDNGNNDNNHNDDDDEEEDEEIHDRDTYDKNSSSSKGMLFEWVPNMCLYLSITNQDNTLR